MKIFIIGSTGFAGEVFQALEAQLAGGADSIAGVYDDDLRLRRNPCLPAPYLGTIEDLLQDPPEAGAVVLALQENDAREEVGRRLEANPELLPLTVQHPSACVSPTAIIEPGSYIAANVFVGPRSHIGQFAILNVHSSVGYSAQVEAFAQVCPGARISGFCRVGRAAFLGSNAVLAPSVVVGDHAKVGAASFVHRDVGAGVFVLGVPAKPAT